MLFLSFAMRLVDDSQQNINVVAWTGEGFTKRPTTSNTRE